MDWQEPIVDGYDRLPDLMKGVLAGLTAADLDRQPHRDCNSLGWTGCHLTRVQASQFAELMGEPQLGIRGGCHKKFKRTADPDDTGTSTRPTTCEPSGRPAPGSSSITCGRSSSGPSATSRPSRRPTSTASWTSRGSNRGRR